MQKNEFQLGRKYQYRGGDVGSTRHIWTASSDDDTNSPYFDNEDGYRTCLPIDFMEPLVPTLDDIHTLYVGLVLVDEDGMVRRVLGICGEIVFYSKAAHGVHDEEAHTHRFGQTARELNARGWTVQDQEPVKTMTRAEAERQLGIKIEG